MCLACYEQPAMMERVGYRPGPWITEVTGGRRLTVLPRRRAAPARPRSSRPIRCAREVHVKRERA